MNRLAIPFVAVALGLLLYGASVLILLTDAMSHQAIPTAAQPLGWSYPANCCSNRDCRMVPARSVLAGRNGYQVPSKELIPYGDHRIKPSPDSEYHWCTTAGLDTGGTICLFVPPPGV